MDTNRFDHDDPFVFLLLPPFVSITFVVPEIAFWNQVPMVRRQSRDLHYGTDFDRAYARPGIFAAMPIASSRSLALTRK